MGKFEWKDIKDGFRGFERLALEYVRRECSIGGISWEKTPETRDGNRDGYSVILGFRPNDLSPEEWWMEAKYSTARERLTRYRLDATIVSAVIHGNVSKIIFVTNISISSKTVVDIRTALKRAIHCRNVLFCTKEILEYWLSQNQDIFFEYFPCSDPPILPAKSIFLSEEIDFYSDFKQGQSFCEPANHLQLGREYYLYFSVFSSEAHTLPLTIAKAFSGVTLLSGGTVPISPGINTCIVKVRLQPEYQMKLATADGQVRETADNLDGVFLRLGSLDILTKRPLDVLCASEARLELPSQAAILQRLETSYTQFQSRNISALHSLVGASATGKSFLLEQFERRQLQTGQPVFHISFSLNGFSNDVNLYYLLIFILFPYLPPDTVDTKYLDSLQPSTIVGPIIRQAAQYQSQPDQLHKLYLNATAEEIFPPELHLNARIILLDDLHKLNEDSRIFLYAILTELRHKKQPIFVILGVWPVLCESRTYFDMREKVHLLEHQCELTQADLAFALRHSGGLKFQIDEQLCRVIFPNIIELLAFLNYCQALSISCLEDFLIACRLFAGSDLAAEYILAPFGKLFEGDADARKLCMQIYWAVNGVAPHTPLTSAERNLLSHKLVKMNGEFNRLVPFHDQYLQFFRDRFPLTPDILPADEEDIYAGTINVLTSSSDANALKKAAERVNRWKTEGRFYSVLSVLEGIYSGGQKELLRGRIGEAVYYQLYLAYGFGVANSSRTKSGKSVFEKIEEETRSASEPQTQLVRMEVLFELINSSFEWLQHKAAEAYIQKIDTLITFLQRAHILSNDKYLCEKYLLTRQIEMLISAERSEARAESLYQSLDQAMAEYHYEYERAFFQLRYAETLYFRDTEAALDMVEAAKGKLLKHRGDREKFYLWASMDAAFLHIILDRPGAGLTEMVEAHCGLKQDCFNDYRKRLFVLASIYYINNLPDVGNQYLFSDVTTIRELRPRQKAFYYETLALYHALYGQISEAERALEQAAELFGALPTYLAVIRHNQLVLSSRQFSRDAVEFCKNGTMLDGVYHIDPRCIW